MISENNRLRKATRTLTMRIGGWALIVCVFLEIMLSLFGGLGPRVPSGITETIYAVLLVIGMSAIQATQPQTKHWGMIGLLLMVLSKISLISYLARLGGFPIISFFAEVVGYLIVGWVTIKAKVFPVWTGWMLIVSGILYFVDSYYGPADWILFAVLTNSITFVGYGWYMLQQRTPN